MERKPGDRWMIRGPLEYVPPVEVEVVVRRQSIPLDENEGIYVRDIKTGKVSTTTTPIILIRQPCLCLSGKSRGRLRSSVTHHCGQ